MSEPDKIRSQLEFGLQARNQFSLAHMAVVGKHRPAGDESNIYLFGSDWTLVISGAMYWPSDPGRFCCNFKLTLVIDVSAISYEIAPDEYHWTLLI